MSWLTAAQIGADFASKQQGGMAPLAPDQVAVRTGSSSSTFGGVRFGDTGGNAQSKTMMYAIAAVAALIILMNMRR